MAPEILAPEELGCSQVCALEIEQRQQQEHGLFGFRNWDMVQGY